MNVRGLLFKEQEVGYLVGYMAALVAEEEGASTVSTVGGQKIPPVDRFIAGFQAGAKKAVPGIKTPNRYSQDFVDQAKCKEIALARSRRARRSSSRSPAAAASARSTRRRRRASGASASTPTRRSSAPTCSRARRRRSTWPSSRRSRPWPSDAFQGGADAVFDIKSGGVGLGKTSPNAPQEAVDKTKEIEEQISNGEIPNIPETVA